MPLRFEDLKKELRRQDARWTAKETPLALLPDEQLPLLLGYVPSPKEPSLAERERLAKIQLATRPSDRPTFPRRFDWRAEGYVTPVVNQGTNCGSCVAFATCACVESMVRIGAQNPRLPIDLSEAQLFYCYGRQVGRRCDGLFGGWWPGWPGGALDAFQTGGVADEACYKYTSGNQDCTDLCPDWKQRTTKITGHRMFLLSPDAMKQWLSSTGPLIACFWFYQDFVQWGDGIYHQIIDIPIGGHCVCVVGYDEDEEYWICKNSWGDTWGCDKGFFKIGYGECGIDFAMWAVQGIA